MYFRKYLCVTLRIWISRHIPSHKTPNTVQTVCIIVKLHYVWQEFCVLWPLILCSCELLVPKHKCCVIEVSIRKTLCSHLPILGIRKGDLCVVLGPGNGFRFSDSRKYMVKRREREVPISIPGITMDTYGISQVPDFLKWLPTRM